MTWADFYLVCFLVGFLLSAVSLVLGHLNLHLQLPHGGMQGWHIHWGNGAAHGGVTGSPQGGPHAAHGGPHAAHAGQQAESELSVFNFASITAFLAWFGGAGYLLTTYSTLWNLFAFAIALLCGLAGAAAIFWFLGKLVTREENLDPADYQMIGVLGRIVSTIREGGTGEVVYVQGGTRHTCGARSEDGTAVMKGEEVVVTRYEKGIAYVRRWEEMAEEDAAASGELGSR